VDEVERLYKFINKYSSVQRRFQALMFKHAGKLSIGAASFLPVFPDSSLMNVSKPLLTSCS